MKISTNLIDKQVGVRVRSLRDVAGVSMQEAALLSGASISDYQKLEAGELRFKARQLMDLAARFGVAGSAFFEEVEFPEWPGRRYAGVPATHSALH